MSVYYTVEVMGEGLPFSLRDRSGARKWFSSLSAAKAAASHALRRFGRAVMGAYARVYQHEDGEFNGGCLVAERVSYGAVSTWKEEF